MREERVKELREFVEQLIANGIKQSDIAKELGYDRSYLYKLLRAEEISDAFMNALAEFKNRYESGNLHARENVLSSDFILTRDAKAILGVLKATREMHGFAAIIGNAGTGKTQSVKEFASNHANVIYVRCNCLMRTKGVMKALAKKVNLSFTSSDQADMFEELIEYFEENPAMMIFDEIDQIMPNGSVNKLETIRNLYDATKDAGCAIVIVGSPAVEGKLKLRSGKENYGQIDSRIDYIYKTNGLLKQEVSEILDTLNITADAKKEVMELAMTTTKGGIRWLSKVIDKCINIAMAENKKIDNDVVAGAIQIIML